MDVCGEKIDDCRLWWTIDRAAKCVLGWTLGDRGTQTAERRDTQLPHAAHLLLATDFWHPDAKIFNQANPVQGKAHTFTIESLNNRTRGYLARRKRRPHHDSKSKENLTASSLFFLIRKGGGALVPAPQSISIEQSPIRHPSSPFTHMAGGFERDTLPPGFFSTRFHPLTKSVPDDANDLNSRKTTRRPAPGLPPAGNCPHPLAACRQRGQANLARLSNNQAAKKN